MAHTAAAPNELSLSVETYVGDANEIRERLLRLAGRLAIADPYAVDHAEEHLLDAAARCEELARHLRSVATYTSTGARRG